MDVFEAIQGRRSVRTFTDAPVSEADLTRMLEAGRMAPSWANTQCQEIIVVREPTVREGLAETLSEHNPAREAIRQAKVVLALCGRKERAGFKKGLATTVLGDWLLFDVALFSQNVTLAAHALGYGTVHIGLFDHERVAELLSVPSEVQVVELVPIGRPAGLPRVAPHRRPQEEFVHQETYRR